VVVVAVALLLPLLLPLPPPPPLLLLWGHLVYLVEQRAELGALLIPRQVGVAVLHDTVVGLLDLLAAGAGGLEQRQQGITI
jgi:hypothetical protein